jgi:hypothetical protein
VEVVSFTNKILPRQNRQRHLTANNRNGRLCLPRSTPKSVVVLHISAQANTGVAQRFTLVDDMTDNGPKRRIRTHGASGYRAGCKCPVCTLAESERKRNFRATGTGAKPCGESATPNTNVTPIRQRSTGRTRTSASGPARAPEPIGEYEAAVREQCDSSPRRDDRPGTVAQCVAMARILDNPLLVAMHPQTSRQLHTLLTSLDGPPKKSRGHLIAIQRMTARRPRDPNTGVAQHD